MYDNPTATISTSYEKITKTFSSKTTNYIKSETSTLSKTSTSKLFLQHVKDGSIWEEELSIASFVEYGRNVKSIQDDLNVFVKAFENQRKMYKYALAWNKYQNELILDEEMDKLEELLAVHIDNNCSMSEVNKNILSLFKYTKEDNFDFEELSSILGVPRKCIAELSSHAKIK